MIQIAKRAAAWCMALILILTVLPLSVLRVAADEANQHTTGTQVESKLDFTKMSKITEGRNETKDRENKEKVRAKLQEAGAVDCENLYIAGNFENLVTPGGYKGIGSYIQKVSAVEGETIHNATLSFGYWICNSDPQGYIQVYVSADNRNYELLYEQREGNGPAFENSRRTETLELPFEEGQTEIYVKFCMEHWNTYEGAGIAFSTLTINVSADAPVDTNKKPEECTMVKQSHNFNSLTAGEVSAEDIGAYEETNMFFGIDGVPLLSPRNGYEVASAVWLLEAAEGEPLHDCVLTIVGRTFFVNESVKNDNYLKVYASADGVSYTQVKEFRANDNPDDTQRFTVDLTEVVKGSGKAYVKLEWLVFDSPHIFGIRSVTITGNTAGIDNSGGAPTKMVVTNIQSFTELPVGEADKEALYAFKSANLMFGYNKTPLLTASEAGEDAYVTWKLTAAEGETFEDCYLTLIGRFGFVNADKKEKSEMRIHFSSDGESYSDVKVITPTDDQSDKQKIVIDLSAQSYGLTEIYVRVYWKSSDDPAGMGLRAMALVANAGEDYALFTPEAPDRVITDETAAQPTQPGTNAGQSQEAPKKPGVIVWAIVGGVAVAAIAAVAVILGKKKKSAKPNPDDAENKND